MKSAGIYRMLLFTFFVCNIMAQTDAELFLNSVDNNNKRLIAARMQKESDILESRTDLNPNDPVIEYGYFPGNTDEIGNKTIYGVTQAFDFPSVYITKRKIANQYAEKIKMEYEVIRQEILLEALLSYINYVHLEKLENKYYNRFVNSEKLYNSYTTKLNQGNASILDVNKAKILYLSTKGDYHMIIQDKEKMKKDLIILNGGQEYNFNRIQYPFIELEELESIKKEIISIHPQLKNMNTAIKAVRLETNLKKQEWLPKLAVGYEAETELDGTYSGIKAGMSIPLWKNKNTIRQYKAKYSFSLLSYEYEKQKVISEIENEYYKAKSLKELLNEYDEMLHAERDLKLIEKALRLGQISIIEYINELSVYYEILEQYLQVEMEYYTLLAKITCYKR